MRGCALRLQWLQNSPFSLETDQHIVTVSLLPTLLYTFPQVWFFRERGRKRDREIETWTREKCHWFIALACPLLGIKLKTQACSLPGNWTSDLLVPGWMLNHWTTLDRLHRDLLMTAAESPGQLSELSKNKLTGQGTSHFNPFYVNPQDWQQGSL